MPDALHYRAIHLRTYIQIAITSILGMTVTGAQQRLNPIHTTACSVGTREH